MFKRVAIIGTSGSGKTTLGIQIAEKTRIPYVDIDSLNWQAGWQTTPLEEFREKVERTLTRHEVWICGGNYSKVRDIIWGRADTILWLDYPLPTIMTQLCKRTLHRILFQEDLWATGNIETWQKQFLSRESLFLWVLKTRPRHHREYPKLFASPEYQHIKTIRFYSPQQTENWLRNLPSSVG